MRCNECSLKNMPFSFTLSDSRRYHGDGCPSRSMVRTEVDNFYVCHHSAGMIYPGSSYGTPGWSRFK